MNKNTQMHEDITTNLHKIYVAKNHDYGNSVHDTYEKYGLVSFLVRMEDKISRARTLDQKKEQYVSDEKLEDTLLDLANYAIMAVMELRLAKEQLTQEDCVEENTSYFVEGYTVKDNQIVSVKDNKVVEIDETKISW